MTCKSIIIAEHMTSENQALLQDWKSMISSKLELNITNEVSGFNIDGHDQFWTARDQ